MGVCLQGSLQSADKPGAAGGAVGAAEVSGGGGRGRAAGERQHLGDARVPRHVEIPRDGALPAEPAPDIPVCSCLMMIMKESHTHV